MSSPARAEPRGMQITVLHPRWSNWSFLLYAGSLTILGALGSGLTYLSATYGDAAYAGLALVVFLGVAGVAFLLRRDGGHPIAAGLLALVAVATFAAFVVALLAWSGLHAGTSSAFHGFSSARFLLELATLLAALVALRLFRFPFLMLVVVTFAWLLVTDLVSGGGDWSAIVTFVVGLVFLAAARACDGGPRAPYGFWLHLAAGLSIGGSLLFVWHSGHAEWALIALAGVLYVGLSQAYDRSSWAVLGALGILLAATHFAVALTHFHLTIFSGSQHLGGRGWAPAFVFGLAGVLLMLLGGLVARRPAATRPN